MRRWLCPACQRGLYQFDSLASLLRVLLSLLKLAKVSHTMAVAIAIIGTAGAVTNIIDLLGKTIATVYGFQQQCKDADFALLGLLAQLRGLRLVLSKIKEWADADFDDPYHRLRMDLDALITHCRVLISRIDDKISDLGSKQNGSLKMSSRIQLVFGREEIEALQKTIDRDISILGVLLLACNW